MELGLSRMSAVALYEKIARDNLTKQDCLSHHPEYEEKVGCGVDTFSVRSADFGTKCFWVNRIDGTTEKFSHKACVLR